MIVIVLLMLGISTRLCVVLRTEHFKHAGMYGAYTPAQHGGKELVLFPI